MEFDAEMNIYESKFVNNDNMSVVSSISMVATNTDNNFSLKSEHLNPTRLNSKQSKQSGMIKNVENGNDDEKSEQ